jgi:hypothetical protein
MIIGVTVPTTLQVSEDICRKCWVSSHDGDDDWWDDNDSMTFASGYTLCPATIRGRGTASKDIPTTKAPPDWCPRKLEHAMSVAMRKKNV